MLGGPPCEACGGATRVLRIEPHRRLKRRHLWTLECTHCGAAHTIEMPIPQRPH